ncbi:MAG: hypothetical protein AAGH45_12665 [Pseudomonadota bacterium]
MMSRSLTIVAAWAGLLFVAVLLAAFLLMGFLPPISPALDAEGVASIYAENRTRILIGASLTMQSAFLSILWVGAIASQIRRMGFAEARLLADAQMLLGVFGAVLFTITATAWTVAAYRVDRSPELIMMLNDFAWLFLLTPVFQFLLQSFLIGIAILADRREQPLFPRWAAYLNFWVGLALLPGAINPLFKQGPFAWDGVFIFWLPLVAFAAWIVVMAWLVARAAQIPDEVDRQASSA